MKRLLLILLISLLTFSIAHAAKERVSILFVHYSVGTQITQGYCWNAQYRRNIVETLDTMMITNSNDTADIVFRSYRMNDEGLGHPLSDTIPGAGENGCGFDRFGGFDYDFYGGNTNRMRIWNSDNGLSGDAFAGILEQFFKVPNKENYRFWDIFQTHNTPTYFPDSVVENNGYDLIIIKNPYACWFDMTQTQADSIKVLYQILRDSISNHPEINVALAFGTPLLLGHAVYDSSQAKLTYDLATWFTSSNFFTHSNSGQYKNIWKWDSFRGLTVTENTSNKYCLRPEYQATDGSHLSNLGSTTAQESMTNFIRGAVQDILIQRSGGSTNSAPIIGNISDTTIPEQDILNITVTASDPDGTTPTLTAINLPTNASFVDNGNGTGSFTFSPDTTQSGFYSITFIASDVEFADSISVGITVTDQDSITRKSIDELIKAFLDGTATEQDVQDLIREYNGITGL